MMRNVDVRWWQRWVDIEWMLHLIKQRFLCLFLLVKDRWCIVTL
jgi:hypothetical protein